MPPKPRNIGVGLLGYNIGRVHSHAWLSMPLYYYPPPARPVLQAISARNMQKAGAFAERLGWGRTYENWRDLVDDPAVDLIDICTPPNMHAEPAIRAFEAGKHVICEKPLARSGEEARVMLRAAEKSGLKHMVGFNYRFIPAVCYAKKLITEGFAGRVLNFRGAYLNIEVGDLGFLNPNFPLDWHFRSEIAGHGALSDLGSHIVDIARFLMGEVSSVSGATATFVKERPLIDSAEKKGKVDVEDAAVAAVRFANGALGTIETSWMAPGRKDFLRFEVNGTEGSLRFDLERIDELEVCTLKDQNEVRGFHNVLTTSKTHPLMENFWPEQGGGFGWDHSFVNEIHHFVDCIVNDKPVEPLGATFYDGYKNCQILDAIAKSSDEKKWLEITD